MAAVRAVVTGASSATLEEARHRTLGFFREVCRELPQIMVRYNLAEVITLPELRSRVSSAFRKHAAVQNPLVVDMLVYKGQEELDNFISQSKQRHHILSQYVVGPQGSTPQPDAIHHRPGILATPGESDFLKKFYESN